MSDIAISVENLGKMYRIGAHQQRPKNLREALQRAVRAPFEYLTTRVRQHRQFRDLSTLNPLPSKPTAVGSPIEIGAVNPQPSTLNPQPPPSDPTILWALRDVSFEVKRGEVIGVIGRNGAGKSTLLKILSRVTDPTVGRVKIHGRLNSLLEVGTGFHPELTGRENIYLSAAINGMKKAEIDRKFDEIVAFSEIEKFIDTPVKRYSSGMYVRLAFGVAAHLEPDILLVDEVLAVGDAQFQRKCIGKMGQVAQTGRTILVVSHNMTVVASLCSKTIFFDNGRLLKAGPTAEVVSAYIAKSSSSTGAVRWEVGDPQADAGSLRFVQARILRDNQPTNDVQIDEPFTLELDFALQQDNLNVTTSIHVFDKQAAWAFCGGALSRNLSAGMYRHTYCFPANLMNDGPYTITLILVKDTTQIALTLHHAISFTVHESHGREEYLGVVGGCVRPRLEVIETVLN